LSCAFATLSDVTPNRVGKVARGQCAMSSVAVSDFATLRRSFAKRPYSGVLLRIAAASVPSSR